MSKRILLLCLLGVSVAFLTDSSNLDAEVVLNPIADTWLRELAPDASYDADLMSVWSTPVRGGARYGVLSFDVSSISVPITDARLELYMMEADINNDYAFKQEAFLVTPAILDDSTLTWNSYHGSGYTETPLEGLGVYDLLADNTLSQHYSSTATAADVSLLEAQRATGTVSFIFKAVDPETHEEEFTEMNGRHDWADLVYDSGSSPPKIVVNGTEIVATTDTWIREWNGQIYEDDWMSVWFDDDVGKTGLRYGIVEFDLSTITSPITSAKTTLYSLSQGYNEEAFEQQAAILDTIVPTDQIDWATYNSMAVTETNLESLGHYYFERDTETDVYHDSDAASSADLAALESIRQGDGKLVLALKPIPREVTYMITVSDDPGAREWADTESTYTGYGGIDPASHPETWPRLIINEGTVQRTPGDANEDGYVDVSDLGILATNYGTTSGAEWGDADFTGDGAVDVSDLGILATNYGTEPSAAVPEPSLLAGLLALCLAGMAVRSGRKSS